MKLHYILFFSAACALGLFTTSCKKDQPGNSVPVVTTAPQQVDDADGIIISGGNVKVTGQGYISEEGVVYSLSANPTAKDTKVLANTTVVNGDFECDIDQTPLAAGTTYHVRAYVINNANGSGTIAYGNDATFTTSTD